MVIIQNSIHDLSVNEDDLSCILQRVVKELGNGESELLVRLVDKAEIQNLNKVYRYKDKSTNVLSFPSDLPIEIDENILGDVVICTEVVLKESIEQHKSFNNHFMHMAVHGTLHLFGYDHIDTKDAQKMANLERKILAKIGINNPY
ncbi:rRNA maturation RNase YbeY [Candidatus Vesicomyidisocius sp. SY067_SCS001]|uniref:rRNA maturation RNase YbeY n=1 Tax=Candidatus Vesicomyidisocius sp. SY067_SCS001 TaxID=2732590 RepID=UPI001685D52E|nr:rRNA maturation RNase YbeY [Candidatus Vesicomyosocius sp. SY067_SCS001]